MKITKKTMVALLLVSVIGAVQADVVNMAFTVGWGGKPNSVVNGTAYNALDPVAPAAYTGTTWNEPGYIGAYNNMPNSDGVASGINITMGGGSFWSWDAPGNMNALDTYAYGAIGSVSITNATGLYDIYILSQDSNPSVVGSFTLGAETKTTSAVSPATYVEGENYVKFSGVTMDGGVSVAVNSGTVNGVQLVAVPEPATMAFVGLFGFGMYIRRRLFS